MESILSSDMHVEGILKCLVCLTGKIVVSRTKIRNPGEIVFQGQKGEKSYRKLTSQSCIKIVT